MSTENNTEHKGEGHLITEAIDRFYESRTTDNLLAVMDLLAASRIWIPCREDEADALRLEPEILQNSKGYFFPVFTSREEMGEYGGKYTNVQQAFSEAIVLARNYSGYEIAGIVVNAFTTPFNLNWELLDLIEQGANQP